MSGNISSTQAMADNKHTVLITYSWLDDHETVIQLLLYNETILFHFRHFSMLVVFSQPSRCAAMDGIHDSCRERSKLAGVLHEVSHYCCCMFCQAVVEGNQQEPETAIRLKGLLVGNPSLGHVNNERGVRGV